MALCSSNNAPMGTRKVRVIAKIRGFTNQEAEFASGSSWIFVNKPSGEASEPVIVSFGDQSASRKDSYEVDYCYDQSEDNELIFTREVKPLISGVFNDCNATVIAYGARGSGKTSLFQGSSEKPGLAALAIAEILSQAEENEMSVTISFYEVYQDHVSDLLDSKQQAVFVLEDKQGKIQLKGLSRVPVKSVLDFQKLYVEFGLRKPTQKAATKLPRKGHKGLIIYVSTPNEKLDTLATSKMNFVDLAGYEDVRRRSSENLNFVEQSKVNKSIYALLNVVHALSANERHVPYRESKLTRILQDSLVGVNKVLMVSCLNPTFCQDSINIVNMASRFCQKTNRSNFDSAKKIHSLIRPVLISSKKTQIPRTVIATAKKQASSRVPLSEKKVNIGVSYKVKGRKLFDEADDFTPSDKASSVLENMVTVETLAMGEVKPIENVTDITVCSGEGHLSSESCNAQVFCSKTNEKIHKPQNAQLTPTRGKDSEYGEDHPEEVTPCVDVNIDAKSLSLVPEGQNIAKDNNSSLVINDNSPPISVRLRELSNSLKALCSATPPCVKTAEKNDPSHILASTGVLEPKTPITERSTMVEDRLNVKDINSPWGTFSACNSGMKMAEKNDPSHVLVCTDVLEPKTPITEQVVEDRLNIKNVNSLWGTFSVRNSGMKNSLVDEYLRFLNTAEKEDLKRLKGIGEKRATYILEMREESPEPFKNLDDLRHIGLSGKQVKRLMKQEVGGLFD